MNKLSSKSHLNPLVLLFFIISLGGMSAACGLRYDNDLIFKLVKMDNPVYKGKPVSEETLATLRVLIDTYQSQKEQLPPQKTSAQIKAQADNFKLLYNKLGMKYLEIEQLHYNIERLAANLPATQGFSLFPEPSAKEGYISNEDLLLYHTALATRFMERGMYKEALTSLEIILPLFPENERLYHYAGLCAANLGKSAVTEAQADKKAGWYQKADAFYKQAYTLNPDYPELLHAWAVLAYELGSLDEAESLLLKVLSLDSQHTKVLFMLGSLYYSTGRLEEALDRYKAALESTTDPALQAQAEETITEVMEALYEK